MSLRNLIVAVEASTFVGKTKLIEGLVTVSTDGKNFPNSQPMTDIMKVFQNLCTVAIELNAQAIGRQAAIPLSHIIKIYIQNQTFLTASLHLVKRDGERGCVVIIFTIEATAYAQGTLSKLVLVSANFASTSKADERLNGWKC